MRIRDSKQRNVSETEGFLVWLTENFFSERTIDICDKLACPEQPGNGFLNNNFSNSLEDMKLDFGEW